MTKVILNGLVNLENQTSTVNTINANNAVIETAFDNTLSRDGTNPNPMNASLDMNSHQIINLPAPISNYDPIRLMDVNTINGSGITVSPLPIGGTTGQILAKKTNADFDTFWASETVTVTPEQFGYTTYGSGDAGPAIMAAIASVVGAVTVVFGSHVYNIVTPVVVNKDYVSLLGQGYSTTLQFSPVVNGTMITWVKPGTVVTYGCLRNMCLFSSDSIFTKIAVNFIDISDIEMSGILIAGATGSSRWTGANSIGLKTNGRQTSSFYNLKIFADLPIVIDVNPNHVYLCADHFHFYDIYCIGNGLNPIITANDGVTFTNTTFDGYQAWVFGSCGFYYNDTTSVARGYNLSISNVRIEQSPASALYNLYINTHSNMASVSLHNIALDPTINGILIRGMLNMDLENIYFSSVVPLSEGLNMNSTNKSVTIRNCRWEVDGILVNSGLFTRFAYFTAGCSTTLPSDALYSV